MASLSTLQRILRNLAGIDGSTTFKLTGSTAPSWRTAAWVLRGSQGQIDQKVAERAVYSAVKKLQPGQILLPLWPTPIKVYFHPEKLRIRPPGRGSEEVHPEVHFGYSLALAGRKPGPIIDASLVLIQDNPQQIVPWLRYRDGLSDQFFRHAHDSPQKTAYFKYDSGGKSGKKLAQASPLLVPALHGWLRELGFADKMIVTTDTPMGAQRLAETVNRMVDQSPCVARWLQPGGTSALEDAMLARNRQYLDWLALGVQYSEEYKAGMPCMKMMDYLVRSGLVGDLDGAVEVVRSSVAGERYGNWTIDSFQRFITFNKLTEIKPGYPQGWPPAEDVLKLFPMEREFGRWVPEPGHLDYINRKINLEVVPA